MFRLFIFSVKIHQIPHGIFKQKVSFSSKFGSLFSGTTGNSSLLFQLKLYMLLTKGAPSKCKFSDFQQLSVKLTKFFMSSFQPPVSFSLNTAHPSVTQQITLLYFFSSALYTLDKKVSQSANFKIFESSREVHQIPHIIYETKSRFSFNV